MEPLKPCFNCGSTEFSNAKEKVLCDAKEVDGDIAADTSEILLVNLYACRKCGNAQIYVPLENMK